MTSNDDLAQDGQLDTITRHDNLAGTGTAISSDYGYDDADRLTSLTHARGGTTMAGYTWAFDSAGRITGFTSPDGSTTYSYDDNGQLLGADYSAQTDESYTYDANGNRTNSEPGKRVKAYYAGNGKTMAGRGRPADDRIAVSANLT